MAYYVITGKSTCPNTTHALHVADILSSHLPNFKYRVVLKSEDEWPTWLDELNSKNIWHQTTCPVIWKEVGPLGGKSHLIGNLGEFWEYCYDYYGFQSKLDQKALEKIMADNLLISSNQTDKELSKVTIIGTNCHPMLELIIYELQNLTVDNILEIRLFIQETSLDLGEEDLLFEMVDNLREITKNSPQSLYNVFSAEDAIKDCDLLIVITDYSRLPGEDADDWLQRCRSDMIFLADDINCYAKRNMKVVLSHHGPICFNASVLMEFCTMIRLSNIVAVTTDEGISVISMIADKVDQPVENFWCPPVWGFTGIMSYVTISVTPITHDVIRPFKRSLRTKESSKLPKGEITREIKYLKNIIKTDEMLYEEIELRKDKEKTILERPPVLAKIRALMSLLKLWYAPVVGDEIISLGICSNGTFGFPVGVCFSQPVSLNEKRVWEPVANLPLLPATQVKIQEIVLQVEGHLKSFGIGVKFSDNSD